MELIATSGYLLCALSFLILTIILRSSWQGKIQGALAILTSIAAIIWSVISAKSAYFGTFDWLFYVGELARDGFWLTFILVLISIRAEQPSRKKISKWIGLIAVSIILAMLVFLIYSAGNEVVEPNAKFQAIAFCFLCLSVIGLISIEQLFRNTPVDQRWAIKYFCFGVGGLFAYDFYLYSDAELFGRIDMSYLAARGYINALIVPLFVVSAARNPDWTLPVHVSRKFVFHSTTLIGTGVYLIAMSAGGYYLKNYGGDWGAVAQAIFLFSATVLLATIIFSGNMRAKLKIFLARNFFNYKYDYRQEWLRLIGAMSQEHNSQQIKNNAIKVVANIVESPGGLLWVKDRDSNYQLSASWNMDAPQESEPGNSQFISFLRTKEWVIELQEYKNSPDIHHNLNVPNWLVHLSSAWIVVPLMHQAELRGFAVLALPRVKQKLNWEDRELLLTVGQQIASYIALLEANEELYDAQQFEAFNRLSAYVVHDLKNIVAQLSLVVSNAVKHKQNPEFMNDTIATVDNAAQRMTRLLAQLRKGRLTVKGKQEQENLIYLMREAITKRNVASPAPQLHYETEDIIVIADRDRLLSVFEHLIQNAQEATEKNGHIKITCGVCDSEALVNIEDDGCGMSREFIQNKLFKPFQTTKGNAGMGIGVYESREYISSMGGTLSAHSELNKGTTFTIRMPLAEPQVIANNDNQIKEAIN